MNAAILSDADVLVNFRSWSRDSVQRWSDLCRAFLDYERREVLCGSPTPKQLEEHRNALKWLLRFARMFQVTASDPEYPDDWIRRELAGRVRQLEHSWELLNNPMTDVEAEKLLRETFPDEKSQAFISQTFPK